MILEMLPFKETNDLGSVSSAPELSEQFTDIFKSYLIPTNGIHLHTVIGGQGAPLLLLSGWPQNWYSWRLIMQALAEKFTVIAVDPRGVGLSDKPKDGYDANTLAADMFGLMDSLGYEHFAMIGHDIGMWTGYVMAHDHPERISRIALGEAIIPGLSVSPPLLPDDRALSDLLWHFNFNRTFKINEALVRGREDLYFNYQFDSKAGSPESLPSSAREFYIAPLRTEDGLRASFDYYRAIDKSIPQYRERMKHPITMPVLSFAGELACADGVEAELRSVANDVEAVVFKNCGHYPAEECPDEFLVILEKFFQPYEQAVV
ncbi:alpha/beta fold hydrolase [Acinetobacter gerneri]|uniref:alpha/beta fold hydrolase n=1 Tax=Acinetobacter gerneri TaxID=202952 RepID=UPI0028ACFD6B|nr:alpha/beta hydrolase [Acinetobacter gerneri]